MVKGDEGIRWFFYILEITTGKKYDMKPFLNLLEELEKIVGDIAGVIMYYVLSFYVNRQDPEKDLEYVYERVSKAIKGGLVERLKECGEFGDREKWGRAMGEAILSYTGEDPCELLTKLYNGLG